MSTKPDLDLWPVSSVEVLRGRNVVQEGQTEVQLPLTSYPDCG